MFAIWSLAAILVFTAPNIHLGWDLIETQKGGDPSLDGKDALVSPLTENPPGDVLAPDVTPAEGASENRSLLPDDSAPLPFSYNAEEYVHLLQLGDYSASCVYLGDGWFVTAHHTFRDNPKYAQDKIVRIDGKQYGGRLHMFAKEDQAYLQMNNVPEDWPSCRLSDVPLEVGQKLRLFGLTTCSHDGTVDQITKSGLVKVDFVNGDVEGGDSGGGVFDEQGRLVAIICEDITDLDDTDNVVTDHLGALVSPVSEVSNRLPAIPSLEKHVAPVPPQEAALDAGTKYLLFTAEWCTPCKTTKQTVLPEVKKAGYTVEPIDFDTYPDLVKKYNISLLPTYVYILDGVEVGRSVNGSLPEVLSLSKGN